MYKHNVNSSGARIERKAPTANIIESVSSAEWGKQIRPSRVLCKIHRRDSTQICSHIPGVFGDQIACILQRRHCRVPVIPRATYPGRWTRMSQRRHLKITGTLEYPAGLPANRTRLDEYYMRGSGGGRADCSRGGRGREDCSFLGGRGKEGRVGWGRKLKKG